MIIAIIHQDTAGETHIDLTGIEGDFISLDEIYTLREAIVSDEKLRDVDLKHQAYKLVIGRCYLSPGCQLGRPWFHVKHFEKVDRQGREETPSF